MRVIEAEKLVMIDLGNSNYLITREAILNAPTFEAEPTRFGKWVAHKKIGLTYALKCSECEWIDNTPIRSNGSRFNYCPNCGAKMEGE